MAYHPHTALIGTELDLDGAFTFAREQLGGGGGGFCFGAANFDQEECCPYRYNIYIYIYTSCVVLGFT